MKIALPFTSETPTTEPSGTIFEISFKALGGIITFFSISSSILKLLFAILCPSSATKSTFLFSISTSTKLLLSPCGGGRI